MSTKEKQKRGSGAAAVVIILCAAALTALGGRVRQEPEGLTVWGTDRLTGGEAHSCGDHRIAMLCACAAPFCTGPVLLRDAGCTDKSYPGFWADYRRLGGQTEEV